MKTLKKIFPFFAVLSFFVGVFSSCNDDDCGCQPVINFILPSDRLMKDSIIAGADPEQFIIIVGENLAAVSQVWFDGVQAQVNPAFVTDNSIILQLPKIDSSTKRIRLITVHGRTAEADFSVNIPAPIIKMFYCEFVADGQILRVAGEYFIEPLEVFFYDKVGGTIPAEFKVKGREELFITVPKGVADSRPIVVKSGAGTRVSDILFRDRRNIIIDFDLYEATVKGTMLTGSQNPSGVPAWDPDFAYLLPPGFDLSTVIGCDGLFDQMNETGNKPGNIIEYRVNQGDRPVELLRPLWGEWGNLQAKDLDLKFEVFVPKGYEINGVYANIYFPPKGNDGKNASGRELTNLTAETSLGGAWWCPFEAEIDKSKAPWELKFGKEAKTPFTSEWTEAAFGYKGQWMTVSVPLAGFIWNNYERPITDAMADNMNQDHPFPATTKPLTVGNDAIAMGDFTFTWEVFSSVTKQSGDFLLFIDNFRVVPSDGGGVRFGKVGQRAYTGNIFTGGRPYPHVNN